MDPKKHINPDLRSRITGWLRYEMWKRGIMSKAAMAKRLDLAGPTIVNVLNGRTTPGLDVLYKMHRHLGVSADTLLDEDPPAMSGLPPPQRQESEGLSRASLPTAGHERRRQGGGK